MESQAEQTETTEIEPEMPTYAAMFTEWLAANPWAKPSDPLVFHLKKLCATIDAQIATNGEASGSLNSSYLQALRTLTKSNPSAAGQTPPGPIPGQIGIFDPAFT